MGILLIISLLLVIGISPYSLSIYSESDNNTEYKKAPLRQILDDGVSPENVKCNEGKVLFFKISNNTPVCVNETSISKLNNFMHWNLQKHLVDYDYLKYKMNHVSLVNPINLSISNVPSAINDDNVNPVLSLFETLQHNETGDFVYYTIGNSNAREKMIGDVNSSHPDPRNVNYWGLRDGKYPITFDCDDGTTKYLGGSPSIYVENDDTIEIHEQTRNKSSLSQLEQITENVFSYEKASLYKTEFKADDTLVIQNVAETICDSDDEFFSKVFDQIYVYSITFEIIY